MDVIIVCHTEFGLVHKRKVIADKNAIEGVTEGVKNLNWLANNYGAKVTYAVCPEVAEYFPNIDCQIGLHIHPGWELSKVNGIEYYIGDRYLKENCKQSSTSTVLRDYSFAEQYGMIKAGTKHLILMLGKIPQVFVAGRWSINNDTVKALVRNYFTHDCSAPAGQKMSHYDWSSLPRICNPYCPSENDYQVKGDLPLLIVPISQMIIGGNVNPEGQYPMFLKACFEEYYIRSVPLCHICLHSPSMTDNHYLSVMNNLLYFISKHDGVHFKYVNEIHKYD